MHPAFSVIFFTVMSGAGYGLFTLMAFLHVYGFVSFDKQALLVGSILSLVMIATGLMSSTFHLANPKNAWRAFFRFKTSWLSREGVFAVLFFPFGMLYVLGIYLQGVEINALFSTMGIIGAIIAIVTVFSTGMIYACLKTIRQWNTALTPANYIMLGLMLGALFLTAVSSYYMDDLSVLASVSLLIVVLAMIMKAIYYFWIAQVTGPTINTATSFTRGTVRLLDTGHSAGTFLTDEFGYVVSEFKTKLLRALVFVLGFIVPAVLLGMFLFEGMSKDLLLYAAAVSLVGIGVERWLFFAEARHVVNLYHGAQHT